MENLKIRMTRGGTMNLVVDGTVTSDIEAETNRPLTNVVINGIFWPHGNSKGKLYPVNPKHIADDMRQVEAAYLSAVQSACVLP